jgi:hypothetical protein
MTEPPASAPILDCSAIDPAIVVALQQLSAAYWMCADHSAAGIETLFTEDGLLTLGTLALTGRTAIHQFFEQREQTMRTAGRTTRCRLHFLGHPGDGRADPVDPCSGNGALPCQRRPRQESLTSRTSASAMTRPPAIREPRGPHRLHHV